MAAVSRVFVVAMVVVLSSVEAAVFTAEFETKLRSFINTTMGCHHIPGFTLAVVKDSDSWTHGFGTADFTTGRTVDGTTLFNIGSVTKSFTMVLLGILLKEHGHDWTAKVTDILGPGYRFVDDYRTRELTMKDLLSHRTGLAGLDIGLFCGIPREISRADYCRRIAFLPEYKPIRDTFIYNNYMYMILGHVAEKLGGDSWENLVTSKVLQPIGMNSTRLVLVPDDVMKQDVAHPYIYKDGRFENGTLATYSIHPVEPAGAILSNAEDMSKYLQFNINGGKTSTGAQLIEKALLAKAYVATTSVTGELLRKRRDFLKPEFPISDSLEAYGHAWFVSTYRGYRRLWHSGGFHSYATMLWLFPDMNIGIFGSVNGPHFQSHSLLLLETTFYFVADHLLGETPWLNDTTACSYIKPWRNTSNEEHTVDVYLDMTEDELKEYTGSFGNHFLPDIKITSSGPTLLLYMGKVNGILHATASRDKFKFEITEPWEFVPEKLEGTNVTKTTNVTFNRTIDTDDIVSCTVEYDVAVVYTKGVSILDAPFTDVTPQTVTCIPAIGGAACATTYTLVICLPMFVQYLTGV